MSDAYERAEAMDMAADRHADEIARLESELTKADRRTAEQERIITAQREKIERLRDALTEALDRWAGWDAGAARNSHADRIDELRKLTEVGCG